VHRSIRVLRKTESIKDHVSIFYMLGTGLSMLFKEVVAASLDTKYYCVRHKRVQTY
jgi:hypothetical protein